MISYNISVNTGDADTTNVYYFTHKDWSRISKEESDKAFDAAVKELESIYKLYGRFATKAAVIRLFDNFGFEQTTAD